MHNISLFLQISSNDIELFFVLKSAFQ